MKQNVYVRSIFQGDYFGELALLTQTPRSATVKSSNYCTLAVISKSLFYDLCTSFPDVFLKMKKKALNYSDPWKQFKLKLLQQIDYFDPSFYEDEFFDEIHHYMQDEFFEKGTEVIGVGEPCNSILFVVQGQLELKICDRYGKEYVIESLQ